MFLAVFAVMSAVLAVPASAHHSFNTFFDISRTVKIEGVIKSFRLVSPHSDMTVEVKDASGKVATWRITARTGAVNAKREGWKVEEFIGKRVKIEGQPDPPEGGTAMAAGVVTFPDGQRWCVSAAVRAGPRSSSARGERHDAVTKRAALTGAVLRAGHGDWNGRISARRPTKSSTRSTRSSGTGMAGFGMPDGQDRGNCGGRTGRLRRKAPELHDAGRPASPECAGRSVAEVRGSPSVADRWPSAPQIPLSGRARRRQRDYRLPWSSRDPHLLEPLVPVPHGVDEWHGPKPLPGQFFQHGFSAGRFDGNDLVIETDHFTFDPDGHRRSPSHGLVSAEEGHGALPP